MFSRYRTVSFDGSKTIKVPDTTRNRAWLGEMNAVNGDTGYPVIQLMILAETGTRALLGAVFGSTADGGDHLGAQAAAPAGCDHTGAAGPRL
jgi:hypothetical protein